MSISKTVRLNKTKQLIDLNEDKTNFELEFSVQSIDKKPFYIVVSTQEELDSGNELEYKNVENGFISGNITADKDFYKSYYLVLKSNEENECNILIKIKDIPPNQEFKNQLLKQQQLQRQQQMELHNQEKQQLEKTKTFSNTIIDDKTKKWRYIIILIGLLIGGALIYYFFFRNKSASLNVDTGIDHYIEIMDNISYNNENVICDVPCIGGNNSTLLAKINDLII